MSKKSKDQGLPPEVRKGPSVSGKRNGAGKQETSIELVFEASPGKYLKPYAKNTHDPVSPLPGIGEIAETSLHAAIKQKLAKPGDQFEVKIDGKIVDLLRTNGEIVEVQTGNFGKLRPKIERLAPGHPIRVVYPIPVKKTIVQLDTATGEEISRRKSPKKGSIHSIFGELVHFPSLFDYPNVCLEVLFVEIEELRVRDGKGSWRRKFQSILDKRLSGNEKSHVFAKSDDILDLLPTTLRAGFTSSALAKEAGISIHIAREMAYVLKKMGLTKENGKQGREILYRVKKKRRSTKATA